MPWLWQNARFRSAGLGTESRTVFAGALRSVPFSLRLVFLCSPPSSALTGGFVYRHDNPDTELTALKGGNSQEPAERRSADALLGIERATVLHAP